MEFDSALLEVLHEFSELDDFILDGELQGQTGVSQQGDPHGSRVHNALELYSGARTPGSESAPENQPVAAGSSQAHAALSLQYQSTNGISAGGKRNRGSTATPAYSKDLAALQQLYHEKQAVFEKLQQENALLRKRSRMLQLIVNCRDEQVRRLQLLKSGQVADPFIPLGMSIEEVLNMDPVKFMPKWKLLCNELGTYLMEDPSLNNTKLLQMERMMLESYKHVFLINPNTLGLASKHVNTEGPDEEWHAPEGWWQQVAEQMRGTFSPQQLEDACLLHEMYCAWHNKLLEERQPLATALSSLSSGPRYGKAVADATTCTATCNSHTAEDQLVQKLQQNLIKERCLIVLVYEVLYVHVLNPVQCAQVKFHSYPHIPDNIAVLAAIAALGPGHHAPVSSNGSAGAPQ